LEVSTIIEALRECYPLTADSSFMSTYDKWAALYKSMQKTITVDQTNIDQLRKSYSERLISAMADYGDMPADRKHKHSATPSACESFAGTNLTKPIYDSVVFDLTFFNKVIHANEKLFSLHAKVIESCIDVIVSRPVIREHLFVQKIPHYFDETTSSKPYTGKLIIGIYRMVDFGLISINLSELKLLFSITVLLFGEMFFSIKN
jgi:hypothetical protein